MGCTVNEAYIACKKLFKINNKKFNKESLDWSSFEKKAYNSEFVKIGKRGNFEIYEGFNNIPTVAGVYQNRIIKVCDKTGRCALQEISNLFEKDVGVKNATDIAVVSLISFLSKKEVHHERMA